MSELEASPRWRGAVLSLTVLFVLGLVAEALVPATASATSDLGNGPASAWDEAFSRKKPKEDRRKHRRDVNAQIVGGQVVPQGKFTFMTFVVIQQGVDTFLCGGSVIDPSFVLTAAHCVTDDVGNDLAPDAFSVGIGKANRNDLQDEDLFDVSTVTSHPEYDPLTFLNDVAVLELAQPVPATVAKPLKFVGAGDRQFDGAGQDAVVAGWGTTSFGGDISDLMLEAGLDIVSDAACNAAYAGSETPFVPAVMICAAFTGRDSCQGDSGGPLMANGVTGFKVKKGKKKKNGKRRKKKVPITGEIQMGIVSFGVGCAEPNFPGVYARVSAPGINDFIVDVVSS